MESHLLLDNPQTTALRFDSQQDALDFAAQGVEDSKHWLAAHNLDFVKRYENSEIEIVVEVHRGVEGQEHHLVFCSIPNVAIRHTEVTKTSNINAGADNSRIHRDQHFMLIRDAYFVECPEKVIASWVRLEAAKERVDLWRDILGPAQSICHLTDTPSEREGSELWVNTTESDGDGIARVVESIPKILDDVSSDLGKGRWENFSQLELVNLMVGIIRVRLHDSFVGTITTKVGDFPLKIGKVFLSPCNLAA